MKNCNKYKGLLLLLLFGVIFACSGKKYDSAAQVRGFTVEVSFKTAHPFLAEYKRYVSVHKNGKSILNDNLGVDAGGFAYVNVLADGENIFLQTFSPYLFRININSDKVDQLYFATNEENNGKQIYSEDLDKLEFLGQFKFADSPEYSLRYFNSGELGKPDLHMMHGG